METTSIFNIFLSIPHISSEKNICENVQENNVNTFNFFLSHSKEKC